MLKGRSHIFMNLIRNYNPGIKIQPIPKNNHFVLSYMTLQAHYLMILFNVKRMLSFSQPREIYAKPANIPLGLAIFIVYVTTLPLDIFQTLRYLEAQGLFIEQALLLYQFFYRHSLITCVLYIVPSFLKIIIRISLNAIFKFPKLCSIHMPFIPGQHIYRI